MNFLEEACLACKDQDYPISIVCIVKFKAKETFTIICSVSNASRSPPLFRDLVVYLRDFKGIQHKEREDVLLDLQATKKHPFEYANQDEQELHLVRLEQAKEEIEEFYKKQHENDVDYFLIVLENPHELKEDIGKDSYEYLSIYENLTSMNTLPVCKSLFEILKKKQ
jgi:hypothetical protein